MANNYTEPIFCSLKNINLQYGEQIILKDIDLTIHKGERIGFVGRNGCGKSSFCKILSKTEFPDSGEVIYSKNIRVGYLSQESILDDNKTVHDNILDGMEYITNLIKKYEQTPANSAKAGELESEITKLDGWNLEYQINTIIKALKTPEANKIVKNMSGGEKRRIALAKAIISQPDVLLLDEPTNHLDIDAIEWLEQYIKNYKGSCLFITHDRYFLDNITNKIIEISFGDIFTYNGNYSYFIRKKTERIGNENALEDKRQKFLKREINWIRTSPKARTTKAQFRVNRFYDVANQQAPELEDGIDLIIPPAPRIGNKIISLDNIYLKYGDNNLIENFTFEFPQKAKIGIIGPNGTGKTSLLKLIIDTIKPDQGNVEVSENIIFNYIDQNRAILNEENSVLDEISEGRKHIPIGKETVTIWSYLKRFLFTDERIKTTIKYLSGGEKARLALAKVLKNGGNFIILDEPTNDLDLESLRLLEEALINFDGCVIIVSHDRYFLNRVCTDMFIFNDTPKIKHILGNYNDYISQKEISINNKKKSDKTTTIAKSAEKPKKRKLTWKENKEFEEMDDKIMETETQIEELENIFTTSDFYSKYKDKVTELESKLKNFKLTLEKLYLRWEELEKLKD